jgi:carboxylate-amine ligase
MMAADTLTFRPGSEYTLGVEIEFQIVDQHSYALVPLAPHLVENAPEILLPRLSPEFIKSILEIQTGICTDLRDVENDLLQTCSMAEELAAENGCLLYAASLHPFAMAAEQELSSDIRYERIMEELQLLGRRFISQGLHVHVGLPDGDTAIRVGNMIQAFLPLFLSLSTSSPFFQSQDTGLMSYRTKLFESLPLAGIYEYIRDWDDFNEEIKNLRSYGIIQTYRDLWWDARPNPEFGTLEVRICDLPARFSDLLAIVALIQGCVAWLAEEGCETGRFRSYLLQANKWQAVRYGLAGRFVDPTGMLGDQPMSLQQAALALKSKIAGRAEGLRSTSYLEELDNIITRGTGADLQRALFKKTNDFKEVICNVHKGFWK